MMAMLEPGLDRHEWESEWQSLEDELVDDPAGALPELDRLVARMLDARGYDMDDPVALEGDDPEIIAGYLAAHETTRLVEAGSRDVSPGDVAAAVNGYRAVYEFLLTEREPP
jgi:hypothetical protein